jgi:hypothetical protein
MPSNGDDALDGSGSPPAEPTETHELDAIELCRIVSRRVGGEGLLNQTVTF